MSLLIDIFGHEYGYTPRQTCAMPFVGAVLLLQRIKERYPEAKDKPDGIMSIESITGMMGK